MIFWELKHAYPGDPEFTFGNYSDLPYEYVLEAYEKGMKSVRRNHHMLEQPIALLTSIFANTNRDSKKKKDPYKIEDFYLFQETEDKNIPSSTFGAAAMELVKKDQFPRWALFAYKDLKAGASGTPPSVLAYISDHCLILAPVVTGQSVNGMIIAQEAAYGTECIMHSPCGKTIKVSVPAYNSKFYAEENISMPLVSR